MAVRPRDRRAGDQQYELAPLHLIMASDPQRAMDESAGYRISEDQSAGVLEIVHLDQPIALADFTPERSSRCSIFDVDPLLSGRNHRSAAQQWRELSDRLDGRINLESQLLRNLSAAALNPKCPQPSRCGADGIPIIRRDEAKLGVGYLQALASCEASRGYP